MNLKMKNKKEKKKHESTRQNTTNSIIDKHIKDTKTKK